MDGKQVVISYKSGMRTILNGTSEGCRVELALRNGDIVAEEDFIYKKQATEEENATMAEVYAHGLHDGYRKRIENE